jgi:hypothetical protein
MPYIFIYRILIVEQKEALLARIKIKDIPKDQKISLEEMKRVLGGSNPYGPPHYPKPPYIFPDQPVRIIGSFGGFHALIEDPNTPLYEFPADSIPPSFWKIK